MRRYFEEILHLLTRFHSRFCDFPSNDFVCMLSAEVRLCHTSPFRTVEIDAESIKVSPMGFGAIHRVGMQRSLSYRMVVMLFTKLRVGHFAFDKKSESTCMDWRGVVGIPQTELALILNEIKRWKPLRVIILKTSLRVFLQWSEKLCSLPEGNRSHWKSCLRSTGSPGADEENHEHL